MAFSGASALDFGKQNGALNQVLYTILVKKTLQ
jgi:hypothetical protein